MPSISRLLAAALFFVPLSAQAQTAIETVIVTGDRAHLIETRPNDAALGLDKPLIETPRAVTVVSDTTIDRYGVTGVDTLTAITPSAYTASFYGVEGAVNLRGTLAESYFRGFKRADNRGTYSTPLGDAAQIEILRGPPSAIYGAGKVGGLINFVPKSVAAADDSIVSGELTATYGSYSKRNLTGQIGLPLDLGGIRGGVHAYGELDDSFSFYRGIHPSHQLVELSGDFETGAWSLSADYMYYHANGDVQTPGWNRLTQALIDNGTYVTGRNASLIDADGNGRLTLNELGGNPYFYDPNFKPLYIAVPGCGACADATHALDTGVGTAHLDARTVYLAPGVDFSNTATHTGFVELAPRLRWRGSRPPARFCRHAVERPLCFLRFSRFLSHPDRRGAGARMISTAISAPSPPGTLSAPRIAMFTPSARRASTAAPSRSTGATSASAPWPTTSSTRRSISIPPARWDWAGRMTSAAPPPMPACS